MSTLIQCSGEYTEHLVTARKDHYCDDYPRCADGIKAGEPYLRCVAFPRHDANGSKRPWVMKLCQRSDTFQRRMSDREAQS